MANCGARVGFHVPAQQDQAAQNAPRAETAAFVASVPEELPPGKKPESSCCGRGRGWRARAPVLKVDQNTDEQNPGTHANLESGHRR